MTSPKLFLLLFIMILLGVTAKGQANFCSPFNYSQNSPFQKNVNRVLSSLCSNANQSDNGFYNTTARQENNPNATVYGIFQCLGHVTVQACQECVSYAVQDILQRCPNNNNGALGWYDKCWIHYSGDEYFFNKMQEEPWTTLVKTGSATNATSFMSRLGETLRVVARAASEGGRKKFVTKENHSALEPPDISDIDCFNCLGNGISVLPTCCNGKVGAATLKPSCYLRYDTNAFYREASPPPSAPSPPPSPSKDKSKISAVTIIGIAVQSAIIILQVSLCFLRLKYCRARKNSSVPKTAKDSSIESLHFDLDDIKSATNDFSPDNKLGQGGYGEVYKGILPGGQELAVKRLSSSSKQGVPEFKNEVATMAKLRPTSMVSFGFPLGTPF